MRHVDPASQEFARLPRRDQAMIYLAIGWTKEAILDEFGICGDTLRNWMNPERYRARAKRAKAARSRKRAAIRMERIEQGLPAHPKAVVTAAAAADMREMRSRGHSLAQIAEHFGMPRSTIRRHVKDIVPPPQGWPRPKTFDHAVATAMKDAGMSFAQIAAHFGVRISSVFKAVNRFDREEEVRRQYCLGEKPVYLAALFGLGETTIRRHTEYVRRPLVRKIDPEKAREMLAGGMSKAAVARHFGASRRGIDHALARLARRTAA